MNSSNGSKPIINRQRIHKELPMMMESEDQFINGIADLVIETEKQIVLIDYKTFSGNEKSLRWKAADLFRSIEYLSEIFSAGIFRVKK